jgi:hypothetical protein
MGYRPGNQKTKVLQGENEVSQMPLTNQDDENCESMMRSGKTKVISDETVSVE